MIDRETQNLAIKDYNFLDYSVRVCLGVFGESELYKSYCGKTVQRRPKTKWCDYNSCLVWYRLRLKPAQAS